MNASADLLAGLTWECAATAPGAAGQPGVLDGLGLAWTPAPVPGTVAQAWREAGLWSGSDDRDFDADDWWYRVRFPGPPQISVGEPLTLRLEGLATIAEVWLNGRPLLSSQNMFRAYELSVDSLEADNELTVAFRALSPSLARPRPRPRWRTQLIRDHRLRWYRTTFLGRMPGWAGRAAPVGPWRPVTLVPTPPVRLMRRDVRVGLDGSHGVVEVDLLVGGAARAVTPILLVGGTKTELRAEPDGAGTRVTGRVLVPDVNLWWPHTHGPATLYRAQLTVDDLLVPLGSIGFRTLEVDQTDGGFRFVVNGVPVFCRGVCWMPIDAVSLASERPALTESLMVIRSAGMNMVRVTGPTVYESSAFWDLCDQLGILVWQDLMFANIDPPDDDDFRAEVDAELDHVLGELQGRPSLALVCGSSELEQQATMLGLPPERANLPLLTQHIPARVDAILPGTPYLPSTPTGSTLPFHLDRGVSHYYGVGAYLRPAEDARRAGVRFTSECLAFAIPPERATIDEMFGGSAACAEPVWKDGVPRDNGATWDFEDVRDHYVRQLHGADPEHLRLSDPSRYLDLGRATVAQLMNAVMAEWRRPGSGCGGGLIYTGRDLWPGAGWGLLDSAGRPKAPWWAVNRMLQPVAILATDEGLNGLDLHLINDTAEAIDGELVVELFREDLRLEEVRRAVVVPARQGLTTRADGLFDGFRDLTYAYRFGPPGHALVQATWVNRDGRILGETSYFPDGRLGPAQSDVGLAATATATVTGATGHCWVVEVSTVALARWVVVEVPGFVASDSWFHLAPGGRRAVHLKSLAARDMAAGDMVAGEVRALNSTVAAQITHRQSAERPAP